MKRWFLLILSLITASLVNSCGGSGTGLAPATAHIAVADSGNNRILVYNAPLTTDESASVVIGQTSFTQSLANQGNQAPSAATLFSPEGLAMDPSGNLWVADSSNCRVLEFKPPFTNGMRASVVLGQPDFQTTGPKEFKGGVCDGSSPGARGMEYPTGIAIDSQGNVWVADWAATRITEYVPPFSNGMAASVVIGQTNLDNNYDCNGVSSWAPPPALPPAPTAATLCNPWAVAFDTQGNLWVADSGNNRVLKYLPPFSTGMAASLQFGHSALLYEINCGDTVGFPNPNITASTFCDPQAVAFDSEGNLWVSDGYNRVLEFLPPFSNSMDASLVIGASSFTQPPLYSDLPTADLLMLPEGITFDRNGNLVLSDYGNLRVLAFSPPFADGMSATTVVGEPNMTTSTYTGCAPASANALCRPADVLSF